MMLKSYKKSPLPFVGQKRLFLNSFNQILLENIPDKGAGWTVVDAFGGSGLLAHTAKRTLPDARVIYNDFDGFAQRIDLIPIANTLRRELYTMTQHLPKNGRIVDADKAQLLAIIERYPQPQLVQTLAAWLLFSGQQAANFDELITKNWYNHIPKTDIQTAPDYLQGLEITSEPFWDLLPRFAGQDKTLLVLDPPYVSTAQGAYANDVYFGMVQFLRLAAMVRPPFVFFSSTRSELVDYVDLIIAERIHNWQDWAGYKHISLTTALNHSAKYEDNMVYKF